MCVGETIVVLSGDLVCVGEMIGLYGRDNCCFAFLSYQSLCKTRRERKIHPFYPQVSAFQGNVPAQDFAPE